MSSKLSNTGKWSEEPFSAHNWVHPSVFPVTHPIKKVYASGVYIFSESANFFPTYFTISLNFFPTSYTHFYCSLLNFFPNFNFGWILAELFPYPKSREFARIYTPGGFPKVWSGEWILFLKNRGHGNKKLKFASLVLKIDNGEHMSAVFDLPQKTYLHLCR